MDKEAPPQAMSGAARTSHPWGLSWEMALELPGKAFQGQGSLKDTRPTEGGGCLNSSPQGSSKRKPANGDLCLGALVSCV